VPGRLQNEDTTSAQALRNLICYQPRRKRVHQAAHTAVVAVRAWLKYDAALTMNTSAAIVAAREPDVRCLFTNLILLSSMATPY
jgi:hypothetical protein